MDSSDSGQGPVTGFYEHCNYLSSFVKGEEFLE